MKAKHLLSLGLLLSLVIFSPYTLTAEAQSISEPIRITIPDPLSPRYTNTQSANISITPKSNGVSYLVNVSGKKSVTSISGTITIYKGSTQIFSTNVSSGRLLYVKDSISSQGSGTYKITFVGTVSTSSSSETINLEASNSY